SSRGLPSGTRPTASASSRPSSGRADRAYAGSAPSRRVGGTRLDLADYAARTAGRDHARRHVAGHHAASPDSRAVSDGDAAQDDGARADPAVLADGDGFVDGPAADPLTRFVEPGAPLRLHRMPRGEELHARRDHAAVADPDVGAVEKDAVEVDVDGLADVDVLAVFPAHRRHHYRAPEAAQQLS